MKTFQWFNMFVLHQINANDISMECVFIHKLVSWIIYRNFVKIPLAWKTMTPNLINLVISWFDLNGSDDVESYTSMWFTFQNLFTFNTGNISHVPKIRAVWRSQVVWCDVCLYVVFRGVKAFSWFSSPCIQFKISRDARDRSTKCYFVDSYHTEWAIVLTPTMLSSAKFVSVLSRFNLIEGEFSRIWECHEIQFHAFLTLVSSLSLSSLSSVRILLYFILYVRFSANEKKNHQISPGPIDTYVCRR